MKFELYAYCLMSNHVHIDDEVRNYIKRVYGIEATDISKMERLDKKRILKEI